MTRGFLRFLRGNTIALLALFLALGGTTYAAVSLPANSVGTKQLKKNAVTPAKIKKSAVTNAKIAANAVTGAKVKNDSLTGADVLESSLGTVPSATNATNATSAATAATAATAANATALGGVGAGSYVKNSGLTLINASFGDWNIGGGSAADFTAQYFSNVTFLQSASAHASQFANVSVDVPSSLYGKSMSVVGAEVCYDATNVNVQLDALFLNVYTNSTGPQGPNAAQFTDDTNRDDETCRVYNLATPLTLNGDNVVNVVLRLNYTAAGTFPVGRTTVILQPTGTAATPPSAPDATALTRVSHPSTTAAGLAP
jgi:hypothetical protein